jgi:O-antigen/teichoic acid export membrane protein
VKVIYGISYPLTAQYLRLHSIDFLSLLFGAQVTGSMLNGQGKTSVIMKSSVVSLCIGSILGWYLIPRLGIPGLILAMILNKGALVYNLYWIKKNLNITPPLKTSLKIFISACISYIVTNTLFLIVPLLGLYNIIVGGGLFILIYLTMILLTRTLTLEDIQNLKNILGAMGPLTPIFNVFLGFFEKFLINNR